MIPILYEYNETAFTTNGLCRLADCISCTVSEQRNGTYECEFTYPTTGVHFDEIKEGRIIAVTHDNHGDIQPFDIYKSDKSIEGIVTFYAHHISYRLNEITVKPFTATDCSSAIAAIGTYSFNTNPFTFWTNKSVTKNYALTVPNTARSILGGSENSILDVYGSGEYEFDKFDVNLWASRGTASGLEIRYGKNLVEYENSTDYSDVVNGVVPYWAGIKSDGSPNVQVVTTPVYSGQTLYNHRNVVVPLDLTSEFQTKPTLQTLRDTASAYLSANSVHVPDQNIEISFVELWQTTEYEQFAPLQTLQLCDTLTVTYPLYNMISVTAKVVEVVFNVLADRYDSITLGSIPTSLGQAITAKTDEKVTRVYEAVEGLKTVAGDTLQYFWHTSTGGDTGAHITEKPQEEFETDPTNGGANLIARTNGIALRMNMDEIAKFERETITISCVDYETSKVTLGVDNNYSRAEIDYHALRLIDENDDAFFEVEDQRNIDGIATISEYLYDSSGNNLTFTLSFDPLAGSLTVYNISETVITNYTLNGRTLTFTSSTGGRIRAEYLTTDSTLKTFTFGTRGAGLAGAGTATFGGNNVAQGKYSFANGGSNTALGTDSHAEGGSTTAAKAYSHSEGYNTQANGTYSHAEGLGTIAGGQAQLAIGKYNDPISGFEDDYAFIIGNGTNTSNRDNAFTVDFQGNVNAYGVLWADGVFDIDSQHSLADSLQYKNTNINYGQSKTYSVENGARGLIIVTGGSSNFLGAYMYAKAQTGSTIYTKTITSATNITVSSSSGSIVIANGATSGYAFVSFIGLYGAIPN